MGKIKKAETLDRKKADRAQKKKQMDLWWSVLCFKSTQIFFLFE